MSDLSIIPLQDGFETQLSQEWDGAVGTVYVLATPTYTPTTTDTYIVVSPGKTNMQIARVSDYDPTAKTLTIDSISFNKALGVSSTAETHPTGSKVIISDNYQFWADIKTAVNSKVDGNSDDVGVYKFADATARDAFLTSPTNGLQAYLTTEGYWTDYVGGAWVQRATGAVSNASTTVAGKVEIATTAQSIAGTDTGETGALLSILPSDVAKNTQSGTFTYGTDSGGDDTYVVAYTPTLTVLTTGMELEFSATTANTGACTLDVGFGGALAIKTPGGNNPSNGDVIVGINKVRYNGTNWTLLNNIQATTAEKGSAEFASDAEADAGISTSLAITAEQNGKYTPSTLLRNDWITHTFPILIAGNVSGVAGWNPVNISTTLQGSGLGNYNVLGSSLGTFTLAADLPGISASALYSPANNKDIRIKWRMAFSSTSDRNGVGMCITPANIHTAQTDITNGEIRFIRNGATLYAQNANGTTATSTNVTGSLTLSNFNTYEIVFNPGTDIKFYINGSLVATHTTNLPTTGSLVFAFGADNNGSIRSIYTSPITTSIEL